MGCAGGKSNLARLARFAAVFAVRALDAASLAFFVLSERCSGVMVYINSIHRMRAGGQIATVSEIDSEADGRGGGFVRTSKETQFGKSSKPIRNGHPTS